MNNLEFNRKILDVIRTELMAGKTFFEGYYEHNDWNSLSRADRAICMIQYLLDSHELGYPKGFDEVKEYVDKIKGEGDEYSKL